MQHPIALALLVGLALGASPSFAQMRAPRTPSPETLESLVARIPSVARGESGIGKEEQALAKQIQGFKGAAIPLVLPLLDSPEPNVRAFAGFVLRDLEGLKPEHLDALIVARQAGDGWIPPAIARVGTPRAVAFLVDDLKRTPEAQTQVTFALETLGERGAVALGEAFGDPSPVDSRFVEAVCQVFSDLGARASAAVPALVAVMGNPKIRSENRICAVQAVACLGRFGRGATQPLRELRKGADAPLRDAIDAAMMDVGSTEGMSLWAEKLRATRDGQETLLVLRDIAQLRERGRDVGPAVASLLTSADWDVRVAAARTLGYIGYADAAPVLASLVERPEDCRLAWVAAESLGRLRAASATPSLRRAAATYWYPPVREAAAKALTAIQTRIEYVSRWPEANFAMEYFEYENVGQKEGDLPRPRGLRASPDELDAATLQSLHFDAKQVSWDTDGRHETAVRRTPSCGLRVGGGTLLGSDEGEWGGELVYVPEKGSPTTLFAKNVTALHRHPVGILAVTGLAHMTFNDGMLYLVQPKADGAFSLSPWKRLPGAPRASGWRADGSLYIACLSGDVVITPKGDIQMAPGM